MMHWMGLAQVNYKDMKGVVLVNFDPASVTVRMDAPWKTLKELEDYIRANPGKPKASGTGKGGSWDLARAGWLKMIGIPQEAMPWVPSNGAAPAMQELVAGGIDVVTFSLPEARAMIEAKKARPLVVMGDNRSDIFPETPTLKEMGKNWVMGALARCNGPHGNSGGRAGRPGEIGGEGVQQPAVQGIHEEERLWSGLQVIGRLR